LQEIAGAFLAGLGIFTFVLLVARILDLVDLVLARGVPGRHVLALFGFILPSFIEITIPMALLLAIVVAFGRLSADGELLAMRAAGISLAQMFPPVVFFTFAVSLLTLALGMHARPWANRRVAETVYEIAKTRATATLKPQVFNSGFGRMVIYVESIDQETGLMKGILLSDERDAGRRTAVFSSAGRIVTNEDARTVYLQMLDGTSLTSLSGQEGYDKTDFESLEVNLEIDEDVGRYGLSLDLRPSEMRWDSLVAARDARQAAGDPAVEENLEIQRKFVLAAAAMLLGLVGVPLGMQRNRAVRSRSLMVTAVVILAYYFLLTGAMTIVRRQILSPVLGMWCPNAALLLAGIYLCRRVSRDRPLIALPRLNWKPPSKRPANEAQT
jgi:lipopolysaccharide export system permease protein